MADPITCQDQQDITTSTVTVLETNEQEVSRLTLKLRKPRSDRKVKWSTETVDNEHMNKKKSKCCCIFDKPRVFGESSDESEDECDHCHGHVERKKKSVPPGADSAETSSMKPDSSQTLTVDN